MTRKIGRGGKTIKTLHAKAHRLKSFNAKRHIYKFTSTDPSSRSSFDWTKKAELNIIWFLDLLNTHKSAGILS
jgi:hypothetical protein